MELHLWNRSNYGLQCPESLRETIFRRPAEPLHTQLQVLAEIAAPPTSPRPNKFLCDGKRIVKKEEAEKLFLQGLSRGMVSHYAENSFPKYVWAVDRDGKVYEAKVGEDGRRYHGYALSADGERDQCRLVTEEWKARAGTS